MILLKTAHLPDGWHMVKPLLLESMVENDGTQIVADDVFDEYGFADELPDALRDYGISLTEFYEVVEDGAREGSAYDVATLAKLREYVRRDV